MAAINNKTNVINIVSVEAKIQESLFHESMPVKEPARTSTANATQ
jgi:hypothetical protein